MEYIFSGKHSFDDYVQMNKYFNKEMLLKSKIVLILFIIFSILILIFSAVSIFNYVIFDQQINFLEDILPILFFILIIYFVINRPKIFYKKHYESNKLFNEEQQFEINEKEIKIKSDDMNVMLTKEKIYKIKLDKDSIYLYVSTNSMYIIKERYLETKEKFNELKEFIINNYSTSPVKR